MKGVGVVRTRSGDISGISRRRGQLLSGKTSQTTMIGFLIGILTLYGMGTTVFQSHFAGMFISDIEVDEITGKKRIRRRPERHRQKLDPNKPTTEYDAVLEGYLTLVGIDIPSTSLQGVDMYRGITAKFCHIDWKLQEKDPHVVPMFNDLMRQSAMCDSTTIVVDLWDLARHAQTYDSQLSAHVLALSPTGIIFHESRCGSTLMANMLAGFSPKHTRMYSENQVHVQTIKACTGNNNPCNPDLHQKLIQDVFYLSGRTVRKERPQYVFYKISSIGSLSIDSFTAAFPSVPWTYLYRDTVEVMQSHFYKGGSTLSLSRSTPVCLRSKRNRFQSHLMNEITNKVGTKPEDLTDEEFCAAHLASLSLAAIQEYDRTKKGTIINYNQLPDIMWEDLLPKKFLVPLDDTMIQRMKEISKNYSKARTKRGEDATFEQDAESKRKAAAPAVVMAAETYAGEVYTRLQELSGQGGASTGAG